jgi:transcriptional regulator with XRE-family HTH domain
MKSDVALKKIGARLREVRRAKGYSNYEYFAYEFEMNKITIKNMEQGKNFEIATLLKMLEILGVSPEEFFKGIK